MAGPKTQKNNLSVEDFLNSVTDETRRTDGQTLLKIFKKATNQEAKMWGTAIVGFGEYKSNTGTWPLVGFSPRKANLTLYVIPYEMPEDSIMSELLSKLGKNKISKACLYINKLSDVDLGILEEVIETSFKISKDHYSVD